jgi:hypothetical protein
MPYAVREVSNLHIASLAERTDSAIKEVLLSESANSHDLYTPDRKRIESYNKEILDFASWASVRPKLDLPRTHPRMYSIDFVAESTSRHINSRSLRDLVRLYEAIIAQLTESESANLSSGIGDHDLVRLISILDQIDALLVDFIDKNLPLDRPESSPHAPNVEAGSLNSAPTH